MKELNIDSLVGSAIKGALVGIANEAGNVFIDEMFGKKIDKEQKKEVMEEKEKIEPLHNFKLNKVYSMSFYDLAEWDVMFQIKMVINGVWSYEERNFIHPEDIIGHDIFFNSIEYDEENTEPYLSNILLSDFSEKNKFKVSERYPQLFNLIDVDKLLWNEYVDHVCFLVNELRVKTVKPAVFVIYGYECRSNEQNFSCKYELNYK